MPRKYGETGAQQFATAPAVGAAGATYYNTTSKLLFVSDGTVWTPVGAGGASENEVTIATSAPTPVAGLPELWIDPVAMAWSGQTIIQGTVANQAALPAGLTAGDAGKGWVTANTGHLWSWTGNAWVDAGQLQGVQGPPGSTGSQGPPGTCPNLIVSTTAPVSPLVNDIWVDMS